MSAEDEHQARDEGPEGTSSSGRPLTSSDEKPALGSKSDPAHGAHDHTETVREFIRQPKAKMELFGLLVLLFYTFFAGQQSCTMNRTLDEIKKQTASNKTSADAAKQAAETARDTFRLTYRPRLKLVGITPAVQSYVNGKLFTKLDNGRLRVSIDVPNLGPFSARNVRFFRYDNVSARNQAVKLSYENQLPGLPQLIPSKAEGNYSSIITITGERVITPSELLGLQKGVLWATFSVLIVYDDDFGETHHAEYCDLFTLQPYNDICAWPVRND